MLPPTTKRPARECQCRATTAQAPPCWFDVKTWLLCLYCLHYGKRVSSRVESWSLIALFSVVCLCSPNGCKMNPVGTSDECHPYTTLMDPVITPAASTTFTTSAAVDDSSDTNDGTMQSSIVAPNSASGSLVIVDASTTSAPGEEPTLVPIIIGVVIGVIALIALIGLGVWYFKLRRSRYDKDLGDAAPTAVMMHRAPSTQAIPRRSLEKGTGEYTSAPPPTTSYVGGAAGTTVARGPSRYETAPPLDGDRAYETAPPDTRYDHAQEEETRVMF
jgi:hypothetical protein